MLVCGRVDTGGESTETREETKGTEGRGSCAGRSGRGLQEAGSGISNTLETSHWRTES